MQSKHVTIGDSYLNVVDEGSGPPILLVHGFPLDHSMWRFQISEFAKTNRVICPDLRGFGDSPLTEAPVSMKSFADELNALLDALDVHEPIVFCGLSMGGYIGWQFWKYYRDRLSHLIACDTRAADDTVEIARGRKIAAQSVLKTGSQPVADTMVDKLFFESDAEANRPITRPVYDVMSSTAPESIAAGQLAMAARPDATPWLSEITVPMLFIVGEHDVITPPAEMRANADLVSGSSFLQLPKAGHMSPLENAEAFNQGLASFLESEI